MLCSSTAPQRCKNSHRHRNENACSHLRKVNNLDLDRPLAHTLEFVYFRLYFLLVAQSLYIALRKIDFCDL